MTAEADSPPASPAEVSDGRDLPPLDGGSAGNESTPPIGTPTRRPRWMPYAGAATLVVAVGAAATPFLSSRTPEVSDSVPAAATTPADVPSLEDQLAAVREAVATSAHEQQQAQVAVDAALAGFREELSRLTGEVWALQTAGEADRPPAEEKPASGSAEDVLVLRAAIDSLAVQLDDVLARTSTARPKTVTAAAKRPRRAAVRRAAPPPFEVLAVDTWGGEPQMTVRDAADIRLVALGQAVRGWRLAGGEPGRGVVTLQAPGGRSAAYMLTGTRLAPVPAAPLPTLTVTAEPADARVRVMNVGPAYHDRMPLPPGAYDVFVDRPGYQPWRQWVRLDADRVLTVRLAAQAADEAKQ